MKNPKAALLILDGWGIGKQDKSDGIFLAKTPFVDSLYNGPHATLRTDGEFVGLPKGQMGNSEVGHLNIGAGRVVYQDFARINKSVSEGDFFQNKMILEAITKALSKQVSLHLFGLVSDGGVHSHWKHLSALANFAAEKGCQVKIHAITDGRDTDPKSGLGYLNALNHSFTSPNITVVSVVGRYFAMDRDQRWERVKKAYDLWVRGIGTPVADFAAAISNAYENGITDEFMEAYHLDNSLEENRIKEGDVVCCFNFRTDRCREITEALSQKAFPEHDMQPLQLEYYTMTRYDARFKNVGVIFEKSDLVNTLGEVVSEAGRTQVRIAETEKYPHVTFFFSGGREAEFPGEKRLMVQSPKVATYDLQPEMSAPEIADKICQEIDQNTPDFICLNFANPDMVGHTGVPEAIIKAVETTDSMCQKVCNKLAEHGYTSIVIADHGNADKMMNEDGSPNTAHTTHPVPVFIHGLNPEVPLNHGKLADVAPSVLKLMGIDQPSEMTGLPLF
ncbi:MAG: 2,3-bisphosphoglycerate-independent phosphoglycerate mutase [Sphingobacteriales bacterium]|jgi:2,3-bisphosphoglycerate-independent phosphoglycerate mutase